MKKINYPTRLRPFNYGYVLKHHAEYRNALRQCKKNLRRYGTGFADNEAQVLSLSICQFMLAHNYPVNKIYLNFRGYCRNYKKIFELHPELLTAWQTDGYYDQCENVIEIAEQTISQEVAQLDEVRKQELINFVLPRLQFAIEAEELCPEDCGGDNHGDWLQMLKDIHQELQEGNMDLFVKNMWALYCVDWTKVEDDEWDFYCSVYDHIIVK